MIGEVSIRIQECASAAVCAEGFKNIAHVKTAGTVACIADDVHAGKRLVRFVLSQTGTDDLTKMSAVVVHQFAGHDGSHGTDGSGQLGVSHLVAIEDQIEVEEISEAMTESMSDVHTAQVTYAARNSDFDGYEIKAGEYLALLDGKLVGSFTDMDKVTEKIAEAVEGFDPEIITVYYGEDVNEADAEKTAAILENSLSDAEVTVVNGGQPVYYYMISVE